MRVASSPARLAKTQAAESKTVGSPVFKEFKRAFQDASPPVAWKQFRQVAKSIFGDAALAAEPLEGESFRRLDLNRAELRKLAENPALIQEHVRKLRSSGDLPRDTAGWKSSELAALTARKARASLGPSSKGSVAFTVATVNDDFTDKKTNLKHINASVMLVQEAKNTRVRSELSKDTHGVHQDVRRDDKAGSAVVWKKDRATATDKGYALAVRPNGAGMLNRWISWTDLEVDGAKVRMASVHRPPKRFSFLWPKFDAQLAAFVKKSKGPIVIGMDANERNPQRLARATGLKWHAPAGSIDGFLVSPGVTVERTWRLPKGTSDHHPVVAKIRLKTGKVG